MSVRKLDRVEFVPSCLAPVATCAVHLSRLQVMPKKFLNLDGTSCNSLRSLVDAESA